MQDLVKDKFLLFGFMIIFFFMQINEGLIYPGFLLISGVWLAQIKLKKKFIFPHTSLDYPFSAFLITGIISTLFSVNFWGSLQTLLLVTFLVILSYYLVVLYLNKKIIEKIFITLVISCTISSIYGIYHYFLKGLDRAYAFFHYATLDATYLMFIMPVIISRLLWTVSKKEKIYLTLALFPAFLFLILTYTRSSWLGVLGTTLFLVWMRKSKKAFLYITLIILILVLVLPFIFQGKVFERGKSIVDFSEWGDRSLVWQSAFKMIKDYPFTGVGFNTFEEVYNNEKRYYGYKSHRAHEIASHAHYLFLNIPAEMGIPALISFLWLVSVLIRKSWFAFKETSDEYLKSLILGFLGGLVSYLIFAGGGIMIRNNLLILFWLSFGLLMGMERMIKENIRE